MSRNNDIVTFKGQNTFQSTTAVGTTTAGSFVQLSVAGNSSAIFGAEIATVSTLFSRYRIKHLSVHVWCGSNATTNRYWGVKYIPEDTSAPGVVTCLSLLAGSESAVQAYPSTRPASLHLSGRELDVSGIQWRECDDSAENVGTYGELTIIQEAAGAIHVTYDWTIEFTGFAASGLHLERGVQAAILRRPKSLLKTLEVLGRPSNSETREKDNPPPAAREHEDFVALEARRSISVVPGPKPGAFVWRRA